MPSRSRAIASIISAAGNLVSLLAISAALAVEPQRRAEGDRHLVRAREALAARPRAPRTSVGRLPARRCGSTASAAEIANARYEIASREMMRRSRGYETASRAAPAGPGPSRTQVEANKGREELAA